MGLYQFMNPVFLFARLRTDKPSANLGYGPVKARPGRDSQLTGGVFPTKLSSQAGDAMDDGLTLPGVADGMGAFQGKDGRVIVVRNHEVSPDAMQHSGFWDQL